MTLNVLADKYITKKAEYFGAGARFQLLPAGDASVRTCGILSHRGPEFFIIQDGCPRGWQFQPCLLLESCLGDWMGWVPMDEITIRHSRP